MNTINITPPWVKGPNMPDLDTASLHEPKSYGVTGPEDKDAHKEEAIAQGAASARLWLTSTVNKMTLPSNIQLADADNSGTIDRDEFKELVARSGGFRGSEKMFAELDKDGSGTLDRSELAKMFAYSAPTFS